MEVGRLNPRRIRTNVGAYVDMRRITWRFVRGSPEAKKIIFLFSSSLLCVATAKLNDPNKQTRRFT